MCVISLSLGSLRWRLCFVRPVRCVCILVYRSVFTPRFSSLRAVLYRLRQERNRKQSMPFGAFFSMLEYAES